MPDNTGEGCRFGLKAGVSGFFFNDRVLQDGHVQNRKSPFERRETERIIISFQNERTFQTEMPWSTISVNVSELNLRPESKQNEKSGLSQSRQAAKKGENQDRFNLSFASLRLSCPAFTTA
jgi:hypothetical protein